LVFELNENEKIISLKLKISGIKKTINTETIILVFSGKILKNELTLRDYNMKDRDFILVSDGKKNQTIIKIPTSCWKNNDIIIPIDNTQKNER